MTKKHRQLLRNLTAPRSKVAVWLSMKAVLNKKAVAVVDSKNATLVVAAVAATTKVAAAAVAVAAVIAAVAAVATTGIINRYPINLCSQSSQQWGDFLFVRRSPQRRRIYH